MSERRRYEISPAFADLFTTQEDRDDAKLEKVQVLPLVDLQPRTSGSTACWCPPLPGKSQMAVMNWWLGTAANGPANWPACRRCLCWFEIWMMIPPPS